MTLVPGKDLASTWPVARASYNFSSWYEEEEAVGLSNGEKPCRADFPATLSWW